MSATTLAMFVTHPSSWIAQPGCECQSSVVGLVHEVAKTPLVHAASGGNSGFTSQETAILAAALTGLATFLFLLIPILCCLCPIPCTCCGFGKQKAADNKHRNTNNISRSDNESFWSTGSWGRDGQTTDYHNIYGIDMKLPRPWVDNSTSRDEIDTVMCQENGIGETTQSGIVSFSASDHVSAGKNGAENMFSGLDKSRVNGDEVTTEYTTVRRIDMHIAGMNQNEAEGYYTKTFGRNSEMTKDNFMKIYHSYRNNFYGLDGIQ